MDMAFRAEYVALFHHLIYSRKGMYEDAIDEFTKFLLFKSPDPGRESQVAAIMKETYRSSGERGLWHRQIEIIKEEAKEHSDFPMAMAEVYTRLGDSDQAFNWLNKAADRKHPAITNLHIDPDFDALRTDPRFGDLVRRAGFAP
jgi:tetratricopeptide (TPR) repeat protein